MKEEVKVIKKLGEEMGYGHLMSIASSLWRNKMRDEGYPIVGSFVPTCIPFIEKEHRDMHEDTAEYYDEYVK